MFLGDSSAGSSAGKIIPSFKKRIKKSQVVNSSPTGKIVPQFTNKHSTGDGTIQKLKPSFLKKNLKGAINSAVTVAGTNTSKRKIIISNSESGSVKKQRVVLPQQKQRVALPQQKNEISSTSRSTKFHEKVLNYSNSKELQKCSDVKQIEESVITASRSKVKAPSGSVSTTASSPFCQKATPKLPSQAIDLAMEILSQASDISAVASDRTHNFSGSPCVSVNSEQAEKTPKYHQRSNASVIQV